MSLTISQAGQAEASVSVLSDYTFASLTAYPMKSTSRLAGESMGRTIPSWRIVVEEELARMARFRQFLRAEDRAVFDDLLTQCKLYAPDAGALGSSIKEVPLLLSMIFAQHKKLTELEKRLNETPRTRTGSITELQQRQERRP